MFSPAWHALLSQISPLGLPLGVSAAMHDQVVLNHLMNGLNPMSHAGAVSPWEDDEQVTEGLVKEELERVQAAAAREKELVPAPFPLVPRLLSIIAGIRRRERFEQSRNLQLKKAFVGAEKHFSDKEIGLLSRIALKDMLVPKIHLGRYLLCRIVTLTTRLVAMEATVEDPEGDVCLLSMHNFPSMMDAAVDEVDAIFPVGTILVIREPYVKTSLHYDNAFIRVDSPSDVIFPDPSSKLLQGITWRVNVSLALQAPSTVLGWKEAGNRHFKAARWLAAAVAFTRGLALNASNVLLRANRAETYLRLEYLSAALFDAEKVLESAELPDGVRQKAFFRAGRAVYSQGNYEKAVHYFQETLACDPSNAANNTDINAWLHRAHSRLREQKQGLYDWMKLFLASQKSNPTMDVADYVGPVKVVSIPSHGGRGMVATRDVKVGELLVVAKPFVAVFPEELPSSELVLSVNLLTKRMLDRCSFAAIHRIIGKIHGNPDLHDLVYHLCPGPSYPRPPETYPPATTVSQSRDRNPLNSSVDINVALLESICSANMFQPQPIGPQKSITNPEPEINGASALYLLPSLINHSCFENATRTFFREVMVIRARTDIRKGEEITLMYAFGDTAFTRQKRLDGYNFMCTCSMCQDDRADGERACQRREELATTSMASLPPASDRSFPLTAESYRKTINTLESLIKQVLETYTTPYRTAIRPPLVWLYHRLSHEIQAQATRAYKPHLYHQAVANEIKAIEATGMHVIDKTTQGGVPRPRQQTSLPIKKDRGPTGVRAESCVSMMLMIVRSFLALDDHLRAERWLRAAWWLEEITVGGGRQLFDEHYKDILQGTGIGDWSHRVL